jgi:hypothetical protein
MKVAFQLLVLTILLAACRSVPSDAQFRQKLVGTWVEPSRNLELTLNADGTFVSKFTSQEGVDFEFKGTWKVQDGVLVSTITANHTTRPAHPMHVGSVDTCKIIRVNDQELIDQEESCGTVYPPITFTRLTK